MSELPDPPETAEESVPTPGEREIGLACAHLALERQARDVKLLYVGDRLGITGYFVLATVNNRRQARAVKDAIRIGLKEKGYGVPVISSEDPEGRWSLYDYGTVVLHLFDDEGREYYDLDGKWADVPTVLIGEDGSETEYEHKHEPEHEPEDQDGSDLSTGDPAS